MPLHEYVTKKLWRTLAITMVVCVVAFVSHPARGQGIAVRIEPGFGRHNGTVRVLMTRDELETIRLLEDQIAASSVSAAPETARAAKWIIEPSAVGSRTLDFSRRALTSLQAWFERIGLVRVDQIYIVIGRTQRFINESLASIGCAPNLSRTGGIHLMGSSLCSRTAIVINLTGYFFLHSINDVLTPQMEVMAEPPLASIDYRIADRNLSGLAHEWSHIARASATRGLVPSDEPAWIREGFAELMAGIARVHAFPKRLSYVDFHVIRLRKFTDWGPYCRASLREYRADSNLLGGCEYYVGPLAVEYLIARMDGPEKLVALFQKASELMNFKRAFRIIYGLSLDAFEKQVARYLREIAELPEL